MQEPNVSSGRIGHHLREDTRDLHGKARALRLQRLPTLHRCDTKRDTAETAARELPHVRPLLLADVRGAEDSHCPADRLPADRQAVEQPGSVRPRHMLRIYTKHSLVLVYSLARSARFPDPFHTISGIVISR